MCENKLDQKIIFQVLTQKNSIVHNVHLVLFFFKIHELCVKSTVADPVFSRGGGANSPCDVAKLSQKLHEIERIWTPRGASLGPPLKIRH